MMWPRYGPKRPRRFDLRGEIHAVIRCRSAECVVARVVWLARCIPGKTATCRGRLGGTMEIECPFASSVIEDVGVPAVI